MHSFEVHSNESACRKKVRLGLEQVITNFWLSLRESVVNLTVPYLLGIINTGVPY